MRSKSVLLMKIQAMLLADTKINMCLHEKHNYASCGDTGCVFSPFENTTMLLAEAHLMPLAERH